MIDVLLGFLPFENFVYKTKLSPEEVIVKLQNNLEPKKGRKLSFMKIEEHKRFEGRIDGQSFQINRVIKYRPTYLPQINGNVKARENESVVEMKMRLPLGTRIFLALFFGVVGGFVLFVLIGFLIQGTFDAAFLFPVGLLLLLYLITIISFKMESSKSITFFAELFNAKVE